MEDKEVIKEESTASENIENQAEEAMPENGNSGAANKTTESSEQKMQQEINDLKDKYLRLYSEFENFRRRTAKERIDLIKTASEDVIKEIIPVVDDFERAFKASEYEADGTKVREGNHLVFHKLVRILESKGLKAMDGLIGKTFDPETQEAITQIPSPSEDMKGKVIDVVEKGYTLGEKVVRYAKVVTGA
jgi:molecular chaperone GrpE